MYQDARRELYALAAMIGLSLVLNVATYHLHPVVWQDEAAYTDPAINWLQDKGFTSSGWYAQPKEAFWAGNVPLHQGLLIVWIKAFGFSLMSTRGLNYLFWALSALLFWVGLKRHGLVKDPWLRLLGVAVLLSANTIAFSLRSARPDGIAILLACAAFVVLSMEHKLARNLLLLLLEILFPWAGLQLAVFAGLMGGLYFLLFRRYFVPLAITGAGIAIGAGGLVLFYRAHGVWDGFLASIQDHSAESVELGTRLVEAMVALPETLIRGESFMLLLGAYLYYWVFMIPKEKRMRLVSLVPLILTVAIPFFMRFAGKFPGYYFWMLVIPFTAASLAAVEASWSDRVKFYPVHRAVLIAMVGLGMLVGFPTRLAVSVYEYSQRDHHGMEKLVEDLAISPDAKVFADFHAYFPFKQKGAVVFTPLYLNMLTPAEIQSLDYVAIHPGRLEIFQQLGGNEAWVEIDRWPGDSTGKLKKSYNTVVYARRPSLSTSQAPMSRNQLPVVNEP
jgi:hypothetical protein